MNQDWPSNPSHNPGSGMHTTYGGYGGGYGGSQYGGGSNHHGSHHHQQGGYGYDRQQPQSNYHPPPPSHQQHHHQHHHQHQHQHQHQNQHQHQHQHQPPQHHHHHHHQQHRHSPQGHSMAPPQQWGGGSGGGGGGGSNGHSSMNRGPPMQGRSQGSVPYDQETGLPNIPNHAGHQGPPHGHSPTAPHPHPQGYPSGGSSYSSYQPSGYSNYQPPPPPTPPPPPPHQQPQQPQRPPQRSLPTSPLTPPHPSLHHQYPSSSYSSPMQSMYSSGSSPTTATNTAPAVTPTTPQSRAIPIINPNTNDVVDVKKGDKETPVVVGSTADILAGKKPVPPTASPTSPAPAPLSHEPAKTDVAFLNANCPDIVPQSVARSSVSQDKNVLESAAAKLKEVSVEPQREMPSPPALPASHSPLVNGNGNAGAMPPKPPSPQECSGNAGASPPTTPSHGSFAIPPPTTLAPTTPSGVKKYTAQQLCTFYTPNSEATSQQIDRWRTMELLESRRQPPAFLRPSRGMGHSPTTPSSPFPNGNGLANFSRDLMKDVDKPFECLDNKADNKFTVSTPTDRQIAADKKIQGVLNKLTPQKYENNVVALTKLIEEEFADLDLFDTIVGAVFEKAIAEPNFSDLYANLCKDLSDLSARLSPPENTAEPVKSAKSPFRRALLTKCQDEFQKTKGRAAENTAEYDEVADQKIRIRAVGAMKFIGELFIRNLLVERIMHTCIQELLGLKREPIALPHSEEIEMLCKLMDTVGKELDHEKAAPYMSKYFERITEIKKQSDSARLRFMLQDVIELRGRGWHMRKCQSMKDTKARKLDAAECQFSEG